MYLSITSMENLSVKLSSLLLPSTALVSQSALTQNLVGKDKVIIWNTEPLQIDDDTYLEFKEALKKRGFKFYTASQILPYSEFCIALLCSSDYSLM
jgi:hypothetical protein